MYIPELIRKEGLRRGLSPMTIKTYNHCVRRFFSKCHKDPKEVKKQDVKDFLGKLIEKGAGGNTINVYLNALKFFYGHVLNRKLMVYIGYSKTPKALPTVLTKEEVAKLISAIENPKHKLMIKLIYSAGLRVNELVNLKAENLGIANGYGWVRRGKGNKDRMFIIANNLKKELVEHIFRECPYPSSYLFKGFNGHISTATVRAIINQAAKREGISKKIHPHALRHSFATHLIEDGCNIFALQSLLGHSSSETTMVYLHTASPTMINIKSPLDNLHF